MSVKRPRRKAKGKRPSKGNGVNVVPGQSIDLHSPMSDHFPAFIVGNSLWWEAVAHTALVDAQPDEANELEPFQGLLGFWHTDPWDPAEYAKWATFRSLVSDMDERYVVEEDSAKGQHIVICGAGPSLAEHAHEWCHQGDQVWGCNSGVTWLADNGHKVTHGFAVDQTPHMLDEWSSAPDVEYLLATTVHPHLPEYLLGLGRRIRWFHNYVGLKQAPVTWDGETMGYEDWLYSLLFPATVRVGSGLNSVNRAIDVALFMGADKVTVLGADCALRASRPMPRVRVGSEEHRKWLTEDVVMHADGGHALASEATPLTLEGEIDGRSWVTKPDMIISAVWLAKFAQHYGERLNLVGDTLPNALVDKSDEYLKRLPSMVDAEGNHVHIPVEAMAARQRPPPARL